MTWHDAQAVRRVGGGACPSPDIAIADYYEVNKNYLKILEYAFQNNIYIGIATHDKTLIDQCYELIRKYNVDPEMFEFQVLYGVPMDDYLKKHRKKSLLCPSDRNPRDRVAPFERLEKARVRGGGVFLTPSC